MYLLGEQPAYADELINRLQSIPAQLLDGLSPSGEPLELEESQDLAAQLPGSHLYLLENGLIHGRIDDRELFFLHEGDLVGLRQGIDLPRCLLSCDAPLRLIPYRRSEVFQHIYARDRKSVV